MTNAVRGFSFLLPWLAVAASARQQAITAKAPVAIAGRSDPRVRAFLLHDAALSPSQLTSIAGGDVVIKTVPTSDRNDIAVLGVIRIKATRATVIAAARRIGAPAHVFASPAKLQDVQTLRLSNNDLSQLARCEPGDCSSKLDSADMAALRSIVTSRTPDADERVDDYVRRRMVEYVNAYRQRGNVALPIYDDGRRTSAALAFAALLRDSCSILRLAPALARDLVEYPSASSAVVTSGIYWTMDSMPRTRPVLRVMHELTDRTSDASGLTVIAAKQLYANHYFDAGLEVLTAADDSVAGVTGEGAGTIVIVARHYRFDQLPKIGPFDLRFRVVSRLRDVVERDLEQLRTVAR
jgi:hypothetical protein